MTYLHFKVEQTVFLNNLNYSLPFSHSGKIVDLLSEKAFQYYFVPYLFYFKIMLLFSVYCLILDYLMHIELIRQNFLHVYNLVKWKKQTYLKELKIYVITLMMYWYRNNWEYSDNCAFTFSRHISRCDPRKFLPTL